MAKKKIIFADINDLLDKLNVNIDNLNDILDEMVSPDIIATDITYKSKLIVIIADYTPEKSD